MTAWSRGAVGQPPLPQDDGVTGLWHSSSEAPRPASNPGDTLGEDSLAARARALLSTGQVHPGPRGHLLTWLLSRAAEHGAPAACSPVLPLLLASRTPDLSFHLCGVTLLTPESHVPSSSLWAMNLTSWSSWWISAFVHRGNLLGNPCASPKAPTQPHASPTTGL